MAKFYIEVYKKHTANILEFLLWYPIYHHTEYIYIYAHHHTEYIIYSIRIKKWVHFDDQKNLIMVNCNEIIILTRSTESSASGCCPHLLFCVLDTFNIVRVTWTGRNDFPFLDKSCSILNRHFYSRAGKPSFIAYCVFHFCKCWLGPGYSSPYFDFTSSSCVIALKHVSTCFHSVLFTLVVNFSDVSFLDVTMTSVFFLFQQKIFLPTFFFSMTLSVIAGCSSLLAISTVSSAKLRLFRLYPLDYLGYIA